MNQVFLCCTHTRFHDAPFATKQVPVGVQHAHARAVRWTHQLERFQINIPPRSGAPRNTNIRWAAATKTLAYCWSASTGSVDRRRVYHAGHCTAREQERPGRSRINVKPYMRPPCPPSLGIVLPLPVCTIWLMYNPCSATPVPPPRSNTPSSPAPTLGIPTQLSKLRPTAGRVQAQSGACTASSRGAPRPPAYPAPVFYPKSSENVFAPTSTLSCAPTSTSLKSRCNHPLNSRNC